MKKWFGVRHLRWWLWKKKVDLWYRLWLQRGFLPTNRRYDDEYLDAIWRGEQ